MKITMFKYDPAVDAKPYYVTGEVEYTDKMTLLQCIVAFRENVQDVAFDYSCHGRMCGRCAVMLDGVPALSCSTPITDADHTIEPLKGQTIIRDLIVDKKDYHEKLSQQYQRIRIEPITAETVAYPKEAGDKLYEMVMCMRCGMCDAACPMMAQKPGEFAGPATLFAIAHRHVDPYDQADRVTEAVAKGLYHCIQCGMCDNVCQRFELKHLDAWKMLREAAEERGLKPSYAK